MDFGNKIMKVVRKMFWILEARSPPKRSGKCDLVKMCASWSSKKSSGGGDYTTRSDVERSDN